MASKNIEELLKEQKIQAILDRTLKIDLKVN
jgi:hypothetical protein